MLFVAAVTGILFPELAIAQSVEITHGTNLSPASISSIDDNGVNLLTGGLTVRTPVLSMGAKDDPDLFYFEWSGRQWSPNTPTIAMDDDKHIFVSYVGGSAEFSGWIQDPANVYRYSLTQARPGTGGALVCQHSAPNSGQAWLKNCTFTSRDGDVVKFFGNDLASGGYPPGVSRHYELYGNLMMWPGQVVRAGGMRGASYNTQSSPIGSGYQRYGGVDVYNPGGVRVFTTGRYNETSITFTMHHQLTGIMRALKFTTSNLNSSDQNNSYLHPKNVTQYVSGPDGAITSYTFNGAGDITQISSPGGRVAVIGYDGDHRVTSYRVGENTWIYSYNFGINATGPGQTTVKNPLSKNKYIFHAHKYGPVTLVTDELGRQNNYSYDGYDRLEVSQPSGAGQTIYYRDNNGNVKQVDEWNVGNSEVHQTFASYPPGCSIPSATCTRPLSQTSPGGSVIGYAYSPDGILNKITEPTDQNGINPVQKTEYASVPYYAADSSNLILRLVAVKHCQTLPEVSCVGTSDEVVDRYIYSDHYVAGTAANGALPIAIRTELGNGTPLKEVSFTYDAVGNVVARDGPLAGDIDKSYAIFDAARRPIYEIGADPDGGASLPRQAIRHSYNSDGQEILTEKGTISSITFSGDQPVDVSGFSLMSFERKTYDPIYGYLIKQETGAP